MFLLKKNPVHPSYHSDFHRMKFILFILLALLAFVSVVPPISNPFIIKGYITIHIFLETISIVISMLVFAFCWGLNLKDRPGNFLILSSVFFGVAFLDFFHAVSYQGMPDFITPSGPEKGIDFWLAGRLMSAAGLLLFASIPWRKTPPKVNRFVFLFAVIFIASLLTWIIFAHDNWIPRTFIQGSGLTSFKKVFEYVLILFYLLAAFMYWKLMKSKQEFDVVALFCATTIMAMSEFFFTIYLNVEDFYNLAGHLYKCIAYAYVYRAIFLDSMRILVERINYNEKLLSGILDTLPMAVFAKDVKNNFKFRIFNKFAEELYAVKAEDVIGKDDYDFFPKEEADWFRKKDLETVKARAIIDIEEEIIHTLNGPVIVHTRKTIVEDDQNKALLLLGVSEDISRMKSVTASLEEAIFARDEFLIIASHELKTPITSLKLRLQIMQRHYAFNELIMEDINKLLQQVNRLNRLMNSILDVSRIQAGKFVLDIAPVNLNETINLVLNQFEEQLSGIKCQVNVDIPEIIIRPWDQARIEQIFTNLISNTIKYAPGCRIDIKVKTNPVTTTIEFKDYGPGIPKDKQKLVFQRFERAGASFSVSGLGLGLYICKKIVEALHGSIYLESEEGKGTTFIIELPNTTDQLLIAPPERTIPESTMVH